MKYNGKRLSPRFSFAAAIGAGFGLGMLIAALNMSGAIPPSGVEAGLGGVILAAIGIFILCQTGKDEYNLLFHVAYIYTGIIAGLHLSLMIFSTAALLFGLQLLCFLITFGWGYNRIARNTQKPESLPPPP